ncbi:MAG: hypothetical protein RRZ84_06270 [Romboutsia sp.]
MKKNENIKDINEYKKAKKNKYRRRENKKTIKKPIMFLIFIGTLSILIGNIYGYSIVSDLKYDIHYLKNDLKKKEIALEQLQAEAITDKSVQEVEKKAKDELNMDYPKNNQIKYIEVED